MRVPVGRAIRVGRGDEIVVHAKLTVPTTLGRLFVFASEGGSEFSPYVQNTDIVTDKPHMFTPMSLRLTPASPLKELSFTSDIDGKIRIMQEIDTNADARAKVRLQRRICPNLGWGEFLARKVMGAWPW